MLALGVVSSGKVQAVSNGKIVFMQIGAGDTVNVGTVNPDGSDYKLVTSDGMSGYPSVTPNGQKIVYTHIQGDAFMISTMDVNGSNPTSTGLNGYYAAAISNTKLNYFDGDNFTLFSADFDGFAPISSGYSPQLEGVQSAAAYSSVTNKMVTPAGNENGVSLSISDIDGSNSMQLTSSNYAIVPTFSPDGQKVYFICSQDGQAISLCSVNADGSDQAVLASLPNFGFLMASPDGTKLFLATDSDNGSYTDLYVMNSDGSSQNKILENVHSESGFSGFGWSPDSGSIIYPLNVDNQTDIYTVRYDGTSVTNVTNTPDVSEGFFSGSYVWAAAIVERNTAIVENPDSGKDVIIQTPEGTTLTCSSAVKESSQTKQDGLYEYPVGLVNFCFDTDSTDNAVTLTFVTELTPSQVTPRKYNSTTRKYTTLSEASLTETEVDGHHALQLTYTITDNGQLDLNSALGSIEDPVGLAVAAGLAATGQDIRSTTLLALSLVTTAVVLLSPHFRRGKYHVG